MHKYYYSLFNNMLVLFLLRGSNRVFMLDEIPRGFQRIETAAGNDVSFLLYVRIMEHVSKCTVSVCFIVTWKLYIMYINCISLEKLAYQIKPKGINLLTNKKTIIITKFTEILFSYCRY